MPTFLTTSKMHPALAARVEASVRGRRRRDAPRARIAPAARGIARLAAVGAVIAVACAIVVHRHRAKTHAADERAALLAVVRAQSESVTEEERGRVAKAEAWLVRLAGAYEGDEVASELRAEHALDAALDRSAMYVRGPITSFATPNTIAEAASTSVRDAFIACLVDPPAARTEKAMLPKVRAAYSGRALVDARASRVRRLHDAEAGLPLLLPAWAARLEVATEGPELAKLRTEADPARLEAAVRALHAHLLIAVLDEASTAAGPTELDGERPHDVRVEIVDLPASKLLLRARKHVDPNWITAKARTEYASGLDACALASDLRESLDATHPVMVVR